MKLHLADLMCHRVDTANKSYRLVEKEMTSIEAARQLDSIMRPMTHSTDAQNSSKYKETVVKCPIRLTWSHELLSSMKLLFANEIESQEMISLVAQTCVCLCNDMN